MTYTHDDEEDLKRLHEEEIEGQGVVKNGKQENLTENAMAYLQQIKILQEELEESLINIQRIEMAILGYTKSLEDELKGH